jgi:hypothetical protein
VAYNPEWDTNPQQKAPSEPSAFALNITKTIDELLQLANKTAANTAQTSTLKTTSPKSSFNTTYILPPPRLTNATTAILVLSYQKNFEKRQAIRETWGRGHNNIYFVVAHSNCEDDSLEVQDEGGDCKHVHHSFLQHEQARYHDLVEIPIKEHYRILPEKVVQAYQWTLSNLPHIHWLVKVDDDMFVRVQSLEDYLEKYNSHIPMVIGQIVPHSQVAKEGKWAEVEHYNYTYYPYWPQGSAGHIVSRKTAKYIVDESPKLHRYQGEDVSIGIWMYEAVEKHKQLDHVTYIHVPKLFTNEGAHKCRSGSYLMIGHDFTLDDQKSCYDERDEPKRENAWLDNRSNFALSRNLSDSHIHIITRNVPSMAETREARARSLEKAKAK